MMILASFTLYLEHILQSHCPTHVCLVTVLYFQALPYTLKYMHPIKIMTT